MADDPTWLAAVARMQRLAGSPAVAGQLWRSVIDADVRGYLADITCPTLVMHTRGDRLFPHEHGRWIADHIAGSTWIELPGTDHFYFHENADRVAEELEWFIIGRAPSHRLLATMVFADVVDSTDTARAMGNERWHDLLARLDDVIDTETERHDGTLVKHLGDGAFVHFTTPGDALACAQRLHQAAHELGVQLRVGVHTGEVELRDDHDLAGLGVHIAARTQSAAAPGQTLVSRTVRDLLTGYASFSDRGAHELKGIDEPWHLYEPTDRTPPPHSGLDDEQTASTA